MYTEYNIEPINFSITKDVVALIKLLIAEQEREKKKKKVSSIKIN